MECTVKVWSDDVVIQVHQKSKTVWIAYGTYLGKHLEAKGTSESSAAAHWRDAARYSSN